MLTLTFNTLYFLLRQCQVLLCSWTVFNIILYVLICCFVCSLLCETKYLKLHLHLISFLRLHLFLCLSLICLIICLAAQWGHLCWRYESCSFNGWWVWTLRKSPVFFLGIERKLADWFFLPLYVSFIWMFSRLLFDLFQYLYFFLTFDLDFLFLKFRNLGRRLSFITKSVYILSYLFLFLQFYRFIYKSKCGDLLYCPFLGILFFWLHLILADFVLDILELFKWPFALLSSTHRFSLFTTWNALLFRLILDLVGIIFILFRSQGFLGWLDWS